ncbi:DUF6440 family protein [Ruminococcus sp.]|jgi:hypothetical protein|uniref:DUF6440 family protein n=1 Tax=Ruminococcus sp. TaxID=41978 RepID=UPI0025F0B29F|nr:DUF6440 family protein [Ruminococcus sp.]
MSNVKVDKEKNEERFEFISEQQYWGTIYSVFVDKVTGVTYLSSMREGTRVTPLLDKDGKPYIDPRFGGNNK